MPELRPLTTGEAPELPVSREEPGVQFGSRREVLWWALIVVMALVDAVGFWIVLGDVISDERRDLLGFLVVGSALASVVLPHQMGAILRSRSDGFAGSVTAVVFSGVVWFALGAAMVVVRLGADVGETQQQQATGALADPEVSGVSGPVITAFMLACLYLATGLVAGRHAWESGGRSDIEERQLSAELRRATRQLRREQYEQEVARQRLEQAQRGVEEVRARRDLHAELNDAVSDGIAQEIRVGIMYETGDPSATDALRRTEVPPRPGRRGDDGRG